MSKAAADLRPIISSDGERSNQDLHRLLLHPPGRPVRPLPRRRVRPRQRCKSCKSIASRPPIEPPEIPNGRAALVLHQELRRARDAGLPFEAAWAKARMRVMQVDSSWWQTIKWRQPEWKAAYERRGRPAVDRSSLDDAAA